MGARRDSATKSTKTRKRTTANKSSRAARDGVSSKTSKTASKKSAKAGARGDRSKRLLDLVMLLLRARSPVTFREIREQFASYKTANVEAGLRAFERDKAELLELGVPIRYVTPDEDDAIDEGGYVIDLKRYRLPEVRLNTDEVSALVLAASVARAVPGVGYARIVDLALRKLAFDFPEPDTPLEWPPRASAITREEPVLVHFPESAGRTQRELGDRFAQIEAATRNRKRLTLRYQSASTGYVRTRQVDPYGLVYREGSWLLVGHCHLRTDVRSFRLDRIADLAIAPKPKSPDFERPEDFDVRAYATRSPWTFTPDQVEEVELEIRHEAASVGNEDFGPEARRERGEGDVMRVTFPCGNPEYVVSRVLAAKGGLSVRRGARVLERLGGELDAVAELYR